MSPRLGICVDTVSHEEPCPLERPRSKALSVRDLYAVYDASLTPHKERPEHPDSGARLEKSEGVRTEIGAKSTPESAAPALEGSALKILYPYTEGGTSSVLR